jgi:hypothetical protein
MQKLFGEIQAIQAVEKLRKSRLLALAQGWWSVKQISIECNGST